ncbi:7573_t:CDS:2 [Ambispora leptoticha]|uniref:7573_t:CDS:1 n=1 Tax=Ambispora leptoticha TaxID=144679 RepID=A0A9N9FPE3_9GLOM|nr:7573_t:CDS:2 [Ambispora leptoticha]
MPLTTANTTFTTLNSTTTNTANTATTINTTTTKTNMNLSRSLRDCFSPLSCTNCAMGSGFVQSRFVGVHNGGTTERVYCGGVGEQQYQQDIICEQRTEQQQYPSYSTPFTSSSPLSWSGAGEEAASRFATSSSTFNPHLHSRSIRKPLSVGLTEKNTSAFLKINVNTHGRQFGELKLCQNSRKMLNLPNAGGASMLSEVFSYEIMERILGVELLKTEMEVRYSFMNQPMTDYLVNLRHPHYTNPLTIGVSVTRAYAHDRRYTNDDAHRLLTKKLAGVNLSTKNINNARIWKQILHIWCPNGQTANVVKRVYMKMPQEYKSNTVVVVSVVDSKWVFTNNKVVYPPRKKDLPKKRRKKRVK